MGEKNMYYKCLKKQRVIIGLIIFLQFLPGLVFAETEEVPSEGWTMETREEGQISISYNIYKEEGNRGEEITVVEYITKATVDTSLENCIELLKDVSRHSEFTDNTSSEMIRSISGNKWIIRYFSSAPWPLKDFDCVATMTLSEYSMDKKAAFEIVATPSEYMAMDMSRTELFEKTYAFEELGPESIQVTIYSKMSPPIKVPSFMIEMGVVDSAAGVIKKLIDLL